MNLDTEKNIRLTAEQIEEEHIALFGMTGSGKTNTLYVLAEEMLAEGSRITVIDPEGDYGHLRSLDKSLVVGKGRLGNYIDIELSIENAAQAADALSRYDISAVILDVSGFDIEEQLEVVQAYVGQLWKNYLFNSLPTHRLIVDEIQLFAPQGEKVLTKKLFRDIMMRGRKNGLVLAVATQRPQAVDTGIRDQTFIRVFHRVARGKALDAIKGLLPGEIRNAEELVVGIEKGACIFMRGDRAKIAQIRASYTYRPRNRKEIAGVQISFDTSMLDQIKDLIASVKPDVSPEIKLARLQAQVNQLREENDVLRQRLEAVPVTVVEPVIMQAEQLDPVQARNELRSKIANEHEYNRQCRAYHLLIANIKRQLFRDRQILSFLADNEPNEYDTEALRYAIGLSPNTGFSMLPLVKCKLISRRTFRGKYLYKSLVLEQIDKNYPLVGRETGREDIARLARTS